MFDLNQFSEKYLEISIWGGGGAKTPLLRPPKKKEGKKKKNILKIF